MFQELDTYVLIAYSTVDGAGGDDIRCAGGSPPPCPRAVAAAPAVAPLLLLAAAVAAATRCCCLLLLGLLLLTAHTVDTAPPPPFLPRYSYWTQGITAAQAAEETQQLADATKFFLETFPTKTFVFENWEVRRAAVLSLSLSLSGERNSSHS